MQRRSKQMDFVERHVQWVLLAASVVWTLTMVAMYGVQSPNRVEYGDRVLGPAELDAAILLAAEDLQAHLEQLPVRRTRVPEYHAALAQAQAAGVFGTLSDSAIAVPDSLPRGTTFGAPIPYVGVLDPEHEVRLVPALAPTRLALTSGRSVILAPSDASASADRIDDAFLPAAHACSWVCAGGCLDLSAQAQAFRAAGYPDFRVQIHIVGVDLQRQERRGGGVFSEWQDVQSFAGPPALPEPQFDPDSGVVLNAQELRQAHEYVKRHQAELRQPSLPEVVAGSVWEHPPAGASPQKDAEQTRMSVWALDGTAQPGETYRYRLRVNLWNPYVGRPGLLANADGASDAVLLGRWSEPSAPITVAPDVRFFVCGGRQDKRLATVEVWKWHLGGWLAERFQVGVGDVIGAVRQVKTGTDAAGASPSARRSTSAPARLCSTCASTSRSRCGRRRRRRTRQATAKRSRSSCHTSISTVKMRGSNTRRQIDMTRCVAS